MWSVGWGSILRPHLFLLAFPKVVFSAGTLQLESQEQFRRLQILPCCYKLSALAFIVSAYVQLFTVLFIQETEEETLFKKKQLQNWRLKNRSLLGPHRNICNVLGFCGLFSLCRRRRYGMDWPGRTWGSPAGSACYEMIQRAWKETSHLNKNVQMSIVWGIYIHFIQVWKLLYVSLVSPLSAKLQKAFRY